MVFRNIYENKGKYLDDIEKKEYSCNNEIIIIVRGEDYATKTRDCVDFRTHLYR